MEEFSLYNNRTPASEYALGDKVEENRRNNRGRVPSHVRRRSKSLPRVWKKEDLEGGQSSTHVTRSRDDSALHDATSNNNASGADRSKDVSKSVSESGMKQHQNGSHVCTHASASNMDTCATGTPREHSSVGKTGKYEVSKKPVRRVEELRGFPGHRPQSEKLPRKSHGGEGRVAAASGPSTPAVGMYRSQSDGRSSQTLV